MPAYAAARRSERRPAGGLVGDDPARVEQVVRTIAHFPVGAEAQLSRLPLVIESGRGDLVDDDVQTDVLPVLLGDFQHIQAFLVGVCLNIDADLERGTIRIGAFAIRAGLAADAIQQGLGFFGIIGGVDVASFLAISLGFGIEVELEGLGAHRAGGQDASP